MRIKLCWSDDKDHDLKGEIDYDEDVFSLTEFEEYISEMESSYSVTLEPDSDGDFMVYHMLDDIYTNELQYIAEDIMDELEEYISTNHPDAIQ